MPRKWNEEIPYQVLVILTTTGRKNLMQSVIVLCLYDVIQRYGAPKNLSPSEYNCYVASKSKGFLVGLSPSLGMTNSYHPHP